MSDPLKCAVCKVVLTTSDAYHAVKTDAGLVHRECYSGPVAPPDIADDLLADAAEDPVWREAEEEARRDHNDVPLPPPASGYRTVEENEQIKRESAEVNSNHPGGPTEYPETMRNEQIARYRHLLNGGGAVINADERSARNLDRLLQEDLDTPLDPDRRS